MKDYFAVQNLSVGYHGKALIRDIDFAIKKGTILTLIGPNGAGKSTILKTITGQLPAISGRVLVDGQDMMRWSPREMAKQVAVVLTDGSARSLLPVPRWWQWGAIPTRIFWGG